jgi:hypothetical protein
MSPSDQRLRANLVDVDAEGGSGMIFATAVTKMLQPAADIPASRALRLVPRAYWRQRQDGDNSHRAAVKRAGGGAVNGR